MEKNDKQSGTVDEAVNFLIDGLSLGDRTIIADMKKEDIEILSIAFRKRIKGELGPGNGNEAS